jgi:GntR family transcriptional repressor for pyruvate dehydrogenase complex
MAEWHEPLSCFSSIETRKPSEIIITQIRELIDTGILKPGDRLPSERALSIRLQVGRSYVREALGRLESHGVLVTYPQCGTFVTSIGNAQLDRLIENALTTERGDLTVTLESMVMLESQAAGLAAGRATDRELAELAEVHERLTETAGAGQSYVDEALAFHRKLAELSGNAVLASLITILGGNIVRFFRDRPIRSGLPYREIACAHEAILEAVRRRDTARAAETMCRHLTVRIERLRACG